MEKVSSVKERLEETIDLVSAELATLGRSELKLKKVLKRKQRQLELNEERMLIPRVRFGDNLQSSGVPLSPKGIQIEQYSCINLKKGI